MDIRSTCTRQCRHPSARMRHFPPHRHIPGARRCPSARRGSLRKYNPSDGRCPTCHVAIFFNDDVMEKHRNICRMPVKGRTIPRREHVRGRRLPRRHPWTLPCPRNSTCTATRSGGHHCPRECGGGASGGGHADVRRVTWEPGNVPDVHIRHVRTSVPASVHRGGYGDIRGIGDMRPQAPT